MKRATSARKRKLLERNGVELDAQGRDLFRYPGHIGAPEDQIAVFEKWGEVTSSPREGS